MKRREKGLCVLTALLLLTSVLALTVLPGIRFTGYLTAALAGTCVLAVLLGRWAERSRVGRWCWRGFLLLFSMGTLLFLTVEGYLLSRGEQDNSAIPADAVIVLGAGVNGETPSLILQSRIHTAADYLALHPDIPVVLSGGQGPGETITEAEAMRRELVAMGIEADRLFLEEQSTSTAENFAFSKDILERQGIDTDTAVIAVVTSDFHCARAHLIAQREGMRTLDVPSEISWLLLNANYYVREAFAMVKTLIFD